MNRVRPTAARRADGTDYAHKMNACEPRPGVGEPECPPFLAGDARDHWHELSGELADAGLLTAVDGAAFASYSLARARWRVVEHALAESTGSLALTLSVLARQTRADVARAGAEFGLGRRLG